ncbi:MAG: putative photosynthetic complex assembly protein PuhE [Chromatiaceae bacterium]|jgi:putative photosynthetic complex assembly protein 2|nr:putative photosynthetic complex assembly protein PuhE [Chromatiaceae bacterium]
MLAYAAPALFALFVWWLGTGVVLFLDNLPRRTYRWSLLAAGAVLLAALWGLIATRASTDPAAAYAAFAWGVLIWGVLEMTYFMGLVSGPRKSPCPEGCRAWRRFALALATSLYHEVSIVLTGALLLALTWGEPNMVGFWAFVVLWLMRWSAKLNVFLGVPNLNIEWLPEHLRFLQSYMGQRSMNHLFPLSVTIATVVVVLLLGEAAAAGASAFDTVALTLIATLLALAVLEHWFLVLPLPDEALWAWAFKPQAPVQGEAEPQETGDRGRSSPRCVAPVR